MDLIIVIVPPEHGYCTTPGECTCEEGYEGTLCNIDSDPCGHQTPCVHGNCTNIGGGQYTCSCEVGFSGPNCDTDIDECALSPCLNGATCEVSSLFVDNIVLVMHVFPSEHSYSLKLML